MLERILAVPFQITLIDLYIYIHIIYFFNEDGKATVIRPTRKLTIVAENELKDQRLLATPAVDGDAFIVRTETHIYRIENQATSSDGS